MKTKALVLLVGIVSLSWFCSTKNDADDSSTKIVYDQSNQAKCSASWFPHIQTPAPAEGKGSPFDTSSTTNAIFHEWSWQKFLWLTKPQSNGKPLFENELAWVNSHMEKLEEPKGVSVVLSSDQQAAHNAVLRSNPTFDIKGDTGIVYYGIAVNNILYNETQTYCKKIKADTSKYLSNDFTFSVGALELKTAWIAARNIPQAQHKDFYITQAYNTLTAQTDDYALLGMHVVGVVENHPEFIWATFEHDALAPNYNWAKTSTYSDVPVSSDENLMFFEKGSKATIQDLKYEGSVFQNVFSIFPYGIPRTLNDSIMPNTAQSIKSNKSNLHNIRALNACVRQGLGDTSVWSSYFYNGSIWIDMDGKTKEEQVVQILDESIYNGSAQKGKPMRGSLACYNITMETYAQEFGQDTIATISANNVVNCFSCHASRGRFNQIVDGSTKKVKYYSPLYLSHIFQGALKADLGTTADAIEIERIKQAIEDLKSHQ